MQADSLRPPPQERQQEQRQVQFMDTDHAKRREAYRKELKALRLFDDKFMTLFFKDNIEGAQLLVRTILDRPDLSIKSVRTQETLINPGRSVRLDILASDSSGVLYNIEVQRENAGADFNRACLHAATLLTHHSMSKSKAKAQSQTKSEAKKHKYPQIYVIFITEKDFFRNGRPLSHFEWMIQEDKKTISESCQHIIYVNGECRYGDNHLEQLIYDFFCSNPNDMKNKILTDRVRYLKEHKEGVKSMCKEFDELLEEAEKRGNAKTVRDAVANAMARGLPMELVADLLTLPVDAVKQIAEQLKAEAAASL